MQPAFFIDHGGGPCFFMEPGPMRDTRCALENHLRGLMARLEEPARAMIDGHTRERALTRWEDARGACHAHPHEDHLLPLLVAAGAASGEPAASTSTSTRSASRSPASVSADLFSKEYH